MKYDCASVEIDQRRWRTVIALKDQQGEIVETFVASADGAFTEGSGIWFGTGEEYAEAEKSHW